VKLSFRDVEREKEVQASELLPVGQLPLDTPDRPVLAEPVPVTVKAEFQDGLVWAWVTARARLTLSCARCLEPFEIILEPAFEVRLTEESGEIVIEDEVRQNILLGLPAQPLCAPSCRGLCPQCGGQSQQKRMRVHPRDQRQPV
jgi:uncharacterized metal-binding protein YceD (DUF177 family)